MDEIEQLKQAIAVLEAQRSVVGDAVVAAGLAPIRARLDQLQSQTGFEQRKLLTVLFADLVGFTALSEQRDPEDIREITNAYFQLWTEAIQAHGGSVEKFIGDAVMAVFGLVAAREDDPENAIWAALKIKSGLEGLNDELEEHFGVRLKMRVGIHTGQVVVSTLGERQTRGAKAVDGHDFVVIGDSVNIASRLQSNAPENGILISHDTYRHVRGVFEVQALEPVSVKGKTEPIRVYQVITAKQRAFRMVTRGVEGIETPLVGREAEINSLQDSLRWVIQKGERQMVTITGEAGIGKSRLIFEFDNWLEIQPARVIYFKGRASPAMQNQAYSLLRDLFIFRFQIMDSDLPQIVRQKMATGIGNSEQAGFIGRLIGFDDPAATGKTLLVDAMQAHDLAIAALRDYLQGLTAQRPVVLLLEDIHWADESSLDVIEDLAKTLAHHPVLIVCATRPAFFERRPTWGERKNGYTRLALSPLQEQDSRRLVKEILQKVDDLPTSLGELIVSNAEGNPFYIEELIKVLIEDQVILREDEHWRVDLSRLSQIRIPPTLTEVLQARFDSLSPVERQLLQRAAVIGRIFWDRAVEALKTEAGEAKTAGLPQDGRDLDSLRNREMIYKRPNSAFDGTQEYLFKHALLRDVTYESLLKRMRRVYHARAALWLEMATEPSQRAGEYASIIAEHYRQAGETGLAIDWYQRAGSLAASHYANAEAVRCFSLCLEMLEEEAFSRRYDLLIARERVYHLQGNRQAQAQDLEVLGALVGRFPTADGEPDRRADLALRQAEMADATGDYAEALTHAQEAVTIAQASSDLLGQARGLLVWGASLWHQAEFAPARIHTEQALVLARRAHLPKLEADCLRQLGVIADILSDFSTALDNLLAALEIYRSLDDRRGESNALDSLGAVTYHMSEYARARDYLDQALRFRRELGDRYGEGITLNNLGLIAYQEADLLSAQDYFERSRNICEEIEDPEGEASSLNGMGTVSFAIGNSVAAQAYWEQALDICQRIGDREGECDLLSALSEGYESLGQIESALEFAQRALTIAQEIGAPSGESYALTYLANALLRLERLDEAAGAYERARQIWQDLRQADLLQEDLAGLAQVNQARGELEKARQYVTEILEHLNGKRGNYHFHILRVYLTCFQVLDALHDPQAIVVLQTAYQILQDLAYRINDEIMRRSFLENVPYHRLLVEAWEKKGE